MKTAIIYTDGACKRNKKGGYGVFYEDDEQIIEISGGVKSTTNNRMELMAIIEAIRLETPIKKRIIFTDSLYVQKGITEWIHIWKKNGWRTSNDKIILNKDLWEQLDSLKDESIQVHWVRGHNGSAGNERADYLANVGVGLND